MFEDRKSLLDNRPKITENEPIKNDEVLTERCRE